MLLRRLSDVPPPSCHRTELVFLGSFSEQVLEHQSAIKIGETVTSVGGLGTKAKDWKISGLETRVPEKLSVLRVNYIGYVARLDLRGSFFT